MQLVYQTDQPCELMIFTEMLRAGVNPRTANTNNSVCKDGTQITLNRHSIVKHPPTRSIRNSQFIHSFPILEEYIQVFQMLLTRIM